MPVPEIDIDEFARRREQGAPVIDVREPDEYQQAHVPGATLIPLATVPDRLGDVPAERDVLVICKSGARSMRAAEFLAANGIERDERRRRHHGLDRLGPSDRRGGRARVTGCPD